MKLLRAARCFFTGHRIISNDDKEFLFERIKNLVSELEEKGIYEFDISDYMLDILRASTNAEVTIEGKTTVTLTIADGELIKYDFYSEYSVFARETNKTTVLTTTKCTFE